MLLSVKQLKVGFFHEESKQFRNVIHGIDLNIEAGKVLALVGESGSGKSVSAMSLIRLLPTNTTRIHADEIIYYKDGEAIDVKAQTSKQMQAIRGSEIAVIFQDPLTALNPVQRVGKQVEEVLSLHRPELKKRAYRDEIIKLFNQVGIKAPEEKIRAYPHELSGGMRQRVMIAIALAGRPKLLIADEPTTSLDVTIQAQILSLLQDLQEEYGMAILFISHDLAVVRALSDRVAVMYRGRIVEENETETLIKQPQHNYTKKLLAASRLIDAPRPTGIAVELANVLEKRDDISPEVRHLAKTLSTLGNAKCACLHTLLNQAKTNAEHEEQRRHEAHLAALTQSAPAKENQEHSAQEAPMESAPKKETISPKAPLQTTPVTDE